LLALSNSVKNGQSPSFIFSSGLATTPVASAVGDGPVGGGGSVVGGGGSVVGGGVSVVVGVEEEEFHEEDADASAEGGVPSAE
jgi:hypothetical protein